MTAIIALLGRMGAGKTAIAEELIKRNYVFQELSFTDGIAPGSSVFVKAGYIDPTKRTKKYRLVKQGIGMKFRELCEEIFGHQDIFIDCLFNSIRFDTVIDDVRMPREVERILEKKNCYVIYLDVPSYIRKERIENRDNGEILRYTEFEWIHLCRDPTEMGVGHAFKQFRDHERFLHLDGRKSIDEIVQDIVAFANLKQIPQQIIDIIQEEQENYLEKKYGKEERISKEDYDKDAWNWH